MDGNECIVVIRPYHPGDAEQCRKILHQATMATVWIAFQTAITREITLELAVAIAAVMFIFLGCPMVTCLLSFPIAAVALYVAIYLGHLFKAKTFDGDVLDIPRVYMSSEYTGFWVAEAVGPENSSKMRIVHGDDRYFLNSNRSGRLVGTAAVVRSTWETNEAWMRRVAVVPEWQRRGVASALVDQVLSFCRKLGYEHLVLVTTECHTAARELYTTKGFQIRQIYHKSVAFFVRILMYEFEYFFS